MPKPICGNQGIVTDNTGQVILTIFGIIGTIGSIIGVGIKAAGITTLPILGTTGAGIGLIGLGAVAGGAAVLITVFAFYFDRCLNKPDGLNACSAGVVNEIVEAFNEGADELFPFTAMHDRVDVVVKSNYWHLVQNNAEFVKCASDPLSSPIIQGLYETPEVCAAGLGATIGALVGAIGGIILGILLGAALGCAATGPFYLLCLLLAIIIAAIVAAVIALIGAFIGGQIGKAIAEETTPSASDGNALQTGDYVTTKGNLAIIGNFDGARVYWFVTETTLHGRSTGSPQFSHTDPDTNLTTDACPIEQPPIH
jgi:hypothetical protein